MGVNTKVTSLADVKAIISIARAVLSLGMWGISIHDLHLG